MHAAAVFNVLVVHEDPLLRAGLVTALRQQLGLDVFVEGDGALARIDVVIADHAGAMRLVEPDGRARRGLGSARIFVLAASDREADIRRAVEAGVHGYLLLGCALSELVHAVTVVARGGRYLCRSVAARMADSLTRVPLTGRELQVLQLVSAGDSNKAIARRLCIELGTVKSHMSAVLDKLGATSRTQAASIASQRGLLEHGSLPSAPPIQSGLQRLEDGVHAIRSVEGRLHAAA
jgi:DNA-binding NarL/FixJ family response regulator